MPTLTVKNYREFLFFHESKVATLGAYNSNRGIPLSYPPPLLTPPPPFGLYLPPTHPPLQPRGGGGREGWVGGWVGGWVRGWVREPPGRTEEIVTQGFWRRCEAFLQLVCFGRSHIQTNNTTSGNVNFGTSIFRTSHNSQIPMQ